MDMQRKLLQEKSLTRLSDNAEKSLNVDLSAKSRLIPYSTNADMLSLNDLYVKERDECENYRIIFTVNPVCTNVLYNAITEPVYKEGSKDVISLAETSIISGISSPFSTIFPNGIMNDSANTNSDVVIDQLRAIRDTEFSHEKIGNFVYHCGYDIFNNHLLRTDDFEHVKMADKPINETKNDKVFNTIFDYVVGNDGKIVQTIATNKEPIGTQARRELVRMYQLDNVKSLSKAFYEGLRTVDGWYGFYNTGYIEIPNGKLNGNEISLNKVLNNKKSCAFIDLYPDRSLYSFIPKPNRYRKRIERNWDCAIFYPYENDYELFNKINDNGTGAVKVIGTSVYFNNVGDAMIRMHSLLRHTLSPGDEVRLYYSGATDGTDDVFFMYEIPVTVASIGDENGNESDRYFSIKQYDISSICEVSAKTTTILDESVTKRYVAIKNPKEGEPDSILFFYKKYENTCEDSYYFRKFKKMKNYEYVECNESEISSPAILYKEPTIVNESSPLYIKLGSEYYKREDRDLAYSQNKLAYGENIYGDRVAQVIFTDDICTYGIKDNLGRPLSDVYFAAVKTNRGHKDWYEKGDLSAETVEYSHCFGDVTSGLDLPEDSNATDYNVRKLYNVFKSECADSGYSAGLDEIMRDVPTGGYYDTPMPLESGITLDSYDVLYGDIVEFNKASFSETTIENVYHRFNTAQRECLKNKKYYDVHYDEIVSDIYDVKTGSGLKPEFSVLTKTMNEIKDENETTHPFPGNINPEGYFYKPFYKIALKELNSEIDSVNVKRINFAPSTASVSTETKNVYNPETGVISSQELYVFNIISPVPYKFIMNEPFCIYDVMEDETYRGYLDVFSAKTNGTCILAICVEKDKVVMTQKRKNSPGISDLERLNAYLKGTAEGYSRNRSAFFISLIEENAPEYAEYIPNMQKLVWRSPIKMSQLTPDSDLYNMPFTNGRLYIHKNLDIFVRRQDPFGGFKLYNAYKLNPLNRFNIAGTKKLDFGAIRTISDEMLNNC